MSSSNLDALEALMSPGATLKVTFRGEGGRAVNTSLQINDKAESDIVRGLLKFLATKGCLQEEVAVAEEEGAGRGQVEAQPVPKDVGTQDRDVDNLSQFDPGHRKEQKQETLDEVGKQGPEKKSPYKRVSGKNVSHTGYISMSKLQTNKAYKMVDLLSTNHEKFGTGELATLVRRNARWNVHLPRLYLTDLTRDGPEKLDKIRADVHRGRNPYLVFRGIREDKSFQMDLYPPGDAMDEYFANDSDVPCDF